MYIIQHIFLYITVPDVPFCMGLYEDEITLTGVKIALKHIQYFDFSNC